MVPNPKWSGAAAQFIYEMVQLGTRFYRDDEVASQLDESDTREMAIAVEPSIEGEIAETLESDGVTPLIDLNKFAGWNTD